MQEGKKTDLIKKAYSIGFEYEKIYGGCAQSAIAAIHDTLNIKDDNVFKAGTGLAAGGGLTAISVCGALAGGIMVISQLCGRERSNFADPERTRFKSYDLAKRLIDGFITEFRSIICRDVHLTKFGRTFYLRDPEDFKKFEETGGHVDKCTDVVGKAAQMTVKIILDEGLVDM